MNKQLGVSDQLTCECTSAYVMQIFNMFEYQRNLITIKAACAMIMQVEIPIKYPIGYTHWEITASSEYKLVKVVSFHRACPGTQSRSRVKIKVSLTINNLRVCNV